MKHSITCNWIGDMAFMTEVTGHKIVLDAASEVGSKDRGPRPKPLVLSALAGCTGMDVISILRKMKQEPSYFNVAVEADATEEHPKYYTRFHVIYEFKEKDNLDREKVEHAVELSQEKYCGVSALLKKAAELTYEIKYI
ncbi:MAG: OsmC family peroxiredoxin [Spirochaetes bacterium]|nr:MAG: OsmC family peroxiredoxin [Spirochaetota bacterium]